MCSTSPRFLQVFQGSWEAPLETTPQPGKAGCTEMSKAQICVQRRHTHTHTTPPPHTSHSQTLTAHTTQTTSTHILHTFHIHPHTHHISIIYIPAHIHTPPTHTAHIHNIHLPHILYTPCTHITHTHTLFHPTGRPGQHQRCWNPLSHTRGSLDGTSGKLSELWLTSALPSPQASAAQGLSAPRGHADLCVGSRAACRSCLRATSLRLTSRCALSLPGVSPTKRRAAPCLWQRHLLCRAGDTFRPCVRPALCYQLWLCPPRG